MKKIATVAITGTLFTIGAFAGTPAAQAYEGNDLNNASIVDAQTEYNDGDTITVVTDGLKPNTKYLLGQCTADAYDFMFGIKIPACAADTKVSATTDNKGHLEADIQVVQYARNAHQNLPGQKNRPDINFDQTRAEILIVQDHGKGFRGQQAADTDGYFIVLP